MTTKREMKTVKDLITYILKTQPHTRNSDTQLYIEACKHLGVKDLDDMSKLGLSIISVHKARQVIQNKEGLYQADEKVLKERGRRRYEIKDYMKQFKNRRIAIEMEEAE